MRIKTLQFVFIVSLIFTWIQSNSQEIKIDHVICVVSNIDSASSSYADKGFTIKKGYQHKNGLINSHIKFQNNTSFELMSLYGEPTDNIAKDYKELLNNGEGCVYIAISGISTDKMIQKLSELEIKHDIIKTNAWNYIVFPKSSGLEHFFFIEYKINPKDNIELYKHKNGSEKINDIYVEGDENILDLLKGIGLQYSGNKNYDYYGEGNKFLTKTGNIIVISQNKISERPRIKSISFGKGDSTEILKIKF
jgi:hypothetical protein